MTTHCRRHRYGSPCRIPSISIAMGWEHPGAHSSRSVVDVPPGTSEVARPSLLEQVNELLEEEEFATGC